MKKFMSRGWFTCVFVCLSCFLISEKLSAEVNGGDEVRTVTLNMWNVSLKEILTEIEKQAGVTFSYESSLLKEFQKTSFKVNDAALDDCLARLFAGYPFVYKRTGNIVVLKRKPRQVTISGFVRDKTSAESLVGASVYEVNSLSGVAANTYGFFSLSLPVPSGSDGAPVRLQASYIGYESHLFTIPVLKQDTVLVIDLQPNAAIGEVLLTALETTRQTVRSTQMGTLEVNHATIRATPTLLGEADIIRTLQLTPGVSAGTEGISGLYVRGGKPERFMHGGGQENGFRAGTENVAGIAGLATAARIAYETLSDRARQEKRIRDYMIKRILREIPYSRLNGSRESRVTGNMNFSFQYVNGGMLVVMLNKQGICASAGSACTSNSGKPSHVLLALGLDEKIAEGSLRLTINHTITHREADYVVECIKKDVARLRELA